MEGPKCDAPVQGGCGQAAKAVVLARSGENMIGNGMAVWTAYWTCEDAHTARQMASGIRRADPDASVFVMEHNREVLPGGYLLQFLGTAL